MKAIKELKLRLPAERKAKDHSSTLNALKYALQCVKQVRGEGLFFFFFSLKRCLFLCGRQKTQMMNFRSM